MWRAPSLLVVAVIVWLLAARPAGAAVDWRSCSPMGTILIDAEMRLNPEFQPYAPGTVLWLCWYGEEVRYAVCGKSACLDAGGAPAASRPAERAARPGGVGAPPD